MPNRPVRGQHCSVPGARQRFEPWNSGTVIPQSLLGSRAVLSRSGVSAPMAFSSLRFRSRSRHLPVGLVASVLGCSLALSACSTASEDPNASPDPTDTGTPTTPLTMACAGTLPADDVSAAVHRVNAGGASLGTLPHFLTREAVARREIAEMRGKRDVLTAIAEASRVELVVDSHAAST